MLPTTVRFRAACLLFSFASAVLTAPQSARGQSLYGGLVGRVTDNTTSSIPKAAVTATNLQTGTGGVRSTTTSDSGDYTFSTLPPGVYSLTIRAEGFRPVTLTGITVAADTTTRMDTTLELGAVSEQITVSASGQTLQTEGAEVRHDMGRDILENSPIPLGRNYESLLVLLPGVAPPQTSNSFTANPSRGLAFSVNGTSNVTNNVRIDGASSYNTNQPQATAINPSLESIEAVSVVTSSLSPEQGLSGGGAVNIQIKSGTNQLRASGFLYSNHEELTAYPYFGSRSGPKAKYRSNQFGGTVGGPIKRNRVFFFFSYERTGEDSSPQRYLTVPTAAMRSGDLTGSPTTIYDPLTGAAFDAARPTLFATDRVPFAGNLVPASRISAPIRKLLALPDWPLPNAPGGGSLGLSGNYLSRIDYTAKRDQIDTKVNYNLTNQWTLFHRLSALWIDQKNPAPFGNLAGPAVHPTNSRPGRGNGSVYSSTVSSTYVLSPTLILDGYFGYTLRDNNSGPDNMDVAFLRDVLGVPGTNGPTSFSGGMGRFLIDNFDQLGYAQVSPSIFHDGMIQYAGNATHTRGKHEFRAGMEMLRWIYNQQNVSVPGSNAGPAGGFNFRVDTTVLRGGASGNAYNSIAALLLGLPREAGRTSLTVPVLTPRANQYSMYAGDRWKLSSRLVMSYGLRWEYFPMLTRADRGMERYDFSTNEVLVCGTGTVPRDCGLGQSKRLFAPRVGLAWRLKPTLVLRAGYGLTYDPYVFARDIRGNYPVAIAQQLAYPDSRSFSTTLEQGLPQPAPIPAGNGRIPLPTTVAFTTADGNYQRGYIQSWNLTVEKQLGSWIVSSGYVATRSVRQSAILNATWSYPGEGSQGTALFKAFRRTATTQYFGHIGVQKYDSLQTRVQRRFRGYQLGLSHTWAHSLGGLAEGSNGTPMVAIPEYWGRNYGPTSLDIRHKFTAHGAFEIPFGHNKRWASSGAPAKVLGGWQVNFTAVSYTGFPSTPTANSTVLNAPGSGNFADCIGTVPTLGLRERWWDRPGLADPNTVDPRTPRFGTCGVGVLRGPGLVNVDMGVFRKFKLGERLTLQFRGEAFNVANTPHFALPNANISSNNFGVISDTANTGRDGIDQRLFRLGLRAGW
ncbi:MAG: TonB-dependent receptor [Acidobacteria bacterium]|nr:TonB-dependent receptor [Acidobacteriota bacterium]